MKDEIIIENLRDIKKIFDEYGIRCWLDWGTLLGAIRDGKRIEWDHDIDLSVVESEFKKIDSVFSKIKGKGFFIKKAPISASELTFRRDGHGVDIWLYYPINQDMWATPYYELSKSKTAHILWLLWRMLAPAYGNADLPKKGFKRMVTVFIKRAISLFPYKSKKYFAKAIKRTLIRNNYIICKHAVAPKRYFEKFKTVKFYGMRFDVPFDYEEYLEYKYGKNWRVPTRKWDPWKDDGAVKCSEKYNMQGVQREL